MSELELNLLYCNVVGDYPPTHSRTTAVLLHACIPVELFFFLSFFLLLDAHDLDNLVPILENIRDNVPLTKPVP